MRTDIAVAVCLAMAVGLPVYAVSQYRKGVVMTRRGKIRRADRPVAFWIQIALELGLAVMGAGVAIRHL